MGDHYKWLDMAGDVDGHVLSATPPAAQSEAPSTQAKGASMTLDDIKFIVFAAIGVGALALLGCILLELRADRIGRMLREGQRRTWVRQEHEG